MLRLAVLAGLWTGGLCAAYAQSCSPPIPPYGSGGTWFIAYQNWCRACGGRPSATASPARCEPGAGWGGRVGGGAGGLSPGQALGRQIGTAAGGLIACALFNQCPGGVDPAVARIARQNHENVNAANREILLRAEREESDRLAQSRRQVDTALILGSGGLRARDLSAAPTVEDSAARQLEWAVAFTQMAASAPTPEQAAELAEQAFAAVMGEAMNASAPPSGTVQVSPDIGVQLKSLRERYLALRNEAYAGMETVVGLEEQRAGVAALRAEILVTMGAAPGSSAMSLRALDEEARTAESRLAAEIARMKREARVAITQAADVSARIQENLGSASASAARPLTQSEKFHFNQGYVHAVQCFSSNAGPACFGMSVDSQARCVAAYGAGYGKGAEILRAMLAEAETRGRTDRNERRRHSGFTSPGASGTCRIEWIEAYTAGYQAAAADAKP